MSRTITSIVPVQRLVEAAVAVVALDDHEPLVDQEPRHRARRGRDRPLRRAPGEIHRSLQVEVTVAPFDDLQLGQAVGRRALDDVAVTQLNSEP